jgi:hypothetical protein
MRNANAAARRVFFRRKYRIKTLDTFLSLGWILPQGVKLA